MPHSVLSVVSAEHSVLGTADTDTDVSAIAGRTWGSPGCMPSTGKAKVMDLIPFSLLPLLLRFVLWSQMSVGAPAICFN